MAIFVGLLSEENKQVALLDRIQRYRSGEIGRDIFVRDVENFTAIDDAAFLYSMPESLLKLAREQHTLSRLGADARQGIGAATRFHRLWWEIDADGRDVQGPKIWPFMAHGTPYSPYYKPSFFRFKWGGDGTEAKADVCHRYPYLNGNYGFKIQAEEHYFSPGLCYGKRTTNFSVQIMPAEHVFSFEGTAISTRNAVVDPWILLGVLNSKPVSYWLARVCAQHKTYNYVQNVPVPGFINPHIGTLARRGWRISRLLDTVNEASNAFLLPTVLRERLGDFYSSAFELELACIKDEIDSLALESYGFSDFDRVSVVDRGELEGSDIVAGDEGAEDDADEEEDGPTAIDRTDGLLSWAIGVAFGRFDWRLATAERSPPPEPDPFDPLPAKSPGMLLDNAAPFHRHAGILVDDPGHPHDLLHLMEEVLARVEAPIPLDARRWIQRDFFPFHLQRYSKSRRKAPIYWPLATVSGSYTLWLYYPRLTSQTLYTAVNDFLEPKLEHLGKRTALLRSKGTSRSREDDRTLEALQVLEAELVELRDTLLRIAPSYRPNHDDGVQITAAPIWPLFRHKPWQKLLKESWAKLEKGEYDWANLAMAYWPDRVREKCKANKSLAIAHGLEHLYVPPEPKAAKPRGRKKASEG